MQRFSIAFFIAFLVWYSSTLALAANIMSVQVKTTPLRAAPSFLSQMLAILSYGDPVEVLNQNNSWINVRLPGKRIQGWLHASSLTTKKILLKAGDTDVQEIANSDEVALAGKGFNRSVESQFQKNQNLDYTWINNMERYVISPQQIVHFLKAGGLTPEGGY